MMKIETSKERAVKHLMTLIKLPGYVVIFALLIVTFIVLSPLMYLGWIAGEVIGD